MLPLHVITLGDQEQNEYFYEGGADMYEMLITPCLRRLTGICTC